jgi:3-phenylpropionate/trans-cinnamate dioxygenase ferredoxin reductase subunit
MEQGVTDRILIIGAGQAGAQAVASLRSEGFTGPITVIGDEPFAPYQRPPLSKAYLMGTLERERLFLKPDTFYRDAGCEMLFNTSVSAINRSAKSVTLSNGNEFGYAKLLLATGSRVREIKCPGASLPGVHYLRGIADVDSLRENFHPGKRLVVVGAGYVGLEVAAVAAKHGLDVTVFEFMDRVMARAVSEPVSAFFDAEHRKAGVKIVLNTGVEAFEGSGKVEAVRAGEQSYPADLALVGIGIVPNEELARAAGLECNDGIVVDQYAATADPDIFAAGDCTRHVGFEGVSLRLESVQNAIDQAKHAAMAMLGKPKLYREVPWFWSDQYDLKLQAAGLARPTDTLVMRGDTATRKFAVFHLRNGVLAAVEAINAGQEYLMGRKLIAAAARPDPAKLADIAVPMKSFG